MTGLAAPRSMQPFLLAAPRALRYHAPLGARLAHTHGSSYTNLLQPLSNTHTPNNNTQPPSAGTYESWRPDASSFLPTDLGNALADWPGERWLNIRSANVRAIMTKVRTVGCLASCCLLII